MAMGQKLLAVALLTIAVRASNWAQVSGADRQNTVSSAPAPWSRRWGFAVTVVQAPPTGETVRSAHMVVLTEFVAKLPRALQQPALSSVHTFARCQPAHTTAGNVQMMKPLSSSARAAACICWAARISN